MGLYSLFPEVSGFDGVFEIAADSGDDFEADEVVFLKVSDVDGFFGGAEIDAALLIIVDVRSPRRRLNPLVHFTLNLTLK